MRRPALLILLALAVPLAAAAGAGPSLRFESERIRLEVRGDTLRVEGLYRFENPSGLGRVPLFYPYPADSLHGRAWTESLAWRPAAGEDWRPLSVKGESERGVRWLLPLAGHPRPEVITVYRQLLEGRHARYIVTTTRAWRRPLARARFELRLPAGTRLTHSSVPFVREGEIWVFEAERFLPAEDIVVEWEPNQPAP